MKRLAALAAALPLLVALGAATPAQGAFGLHGLDITFAGPKGEPQMAAGSHPFAFTTSLEANTEEDPETGLLRPAGGEVKDLEIDFPPGVVANPTPGPRCPAADFLAENCPNSTAIGLSEVEAGSGEIPEGTENFLTVPLYNLIPSPGSVLKLGFLVVGVPVVIEAGIRPHFPFNAVARPTNISQGALFYAARTTVWGVPTSPVHDEERGKCAGPALDSCPVNLPEKPFITMPTACNGPLETFFAADSWKNPGVFVPFPPALTHDNQEPPNPLGIIECDKPPFAPELIAQPTIEAGESPSGMDFHLSVRDSGIDNPTGIAQSEIKEAVVTLPEGMTLNPSAAEGLGACTPAQYNSESVDGAPGSGCPNSSKIGNIEVKTPLLEGVTLDGSLYVAQQDDPSTTTPGAENPFDSLIAIYLVIKDPELGIMVKQAGKVEPDPKTGQLVSTFKEIPQLPFSDFKLHFREGGRSPLITPATCGTHTTVGELTPWSRPGQPLKASWSFKISSGPNGGPCPTGGIPPFHPGFEAGTENNNAASYSPYDMRLTRADGEQDMTKFSSVLPPGLTGKIAGIPKCSDAAIAAAKAKTGRKELAEPSCPAASLLGHTLAGAGVGSQLTYVPGKIYLAGPFGGDPFSVVAITPAVAGPFDAGTVVVRVAVNINPDTAEVEADGSHSDPIPHILKGIVLKVRELRVNLDRPGFTLNPTNCNPSQAKATLFGSFANVFDPADDVPVSLSSRFQAASCESLGFKPKLSLALKGGTKRASHPALTATVTPRSGDANFKQAIVTLPRSAFLDQSHIRTICTRVQFAAHACPAGSIYGEAEATTPLLDETFKGPVYLRSSNHNLPDLVVALHGLVDVNLVGRIDSHKGGIRGSFETIPDVPVSHFVLRMRGGQKGLIVNSRDLCAHRSLATARLLGQNGKRDDFSPAVKPSGCKKTHRR